MMRLEVLQLQQDCRLVLVGPQPHHLNKAKALHKVISSNTTTPRIRRRRRTRSSSGSKFPQFWHPNHYYNYNYNYYNYTFPNYSTTTTTTTTTTSRSSSTATANCILGIGFDDFAAVAHNKVLIAAGVSAAIGQLSKPFTARLLYGKDFDFTAAFQASGFPSTHSSAVVATATSLALERGFSDSIFGLAVVYAGLVMYDAQGVRREVGNHARVLNKVLGETQANSMLSKDRDDDLVDSRKGILPSINGNDFGPFSSKEGTAFAPNSKRTPLLLESDNRSTTSSQEIPESQGTEKFSGRPAALKESVGHSEVEVIAGGLLGFFVSMAVYSAM